MGNTSLGRSLGALVIMVVAFAAPAVAGEQVAGTGVYRGTWGVVKFDVSPPLRDIAPLPVPVEGFFGGMMADPDSHLLGELGPQDEDPVVQSMTGFPQMPLPLVSFDGPSNLSGVAPPDPVGDVGPNHYVAMSNLYFQVYDKSGTSLYGPAANNTLWSGFGGTCQTRNDGDPIVLHDQLADRWILTQFTAGAPYFNCVAVSTTPDPTGSYYRWAFSTGSNFPDYPKYGVWPDALYISTREFAGSSFAGVGAYAVERAKLVAGDPSPTVVSFLLTPASAGGAYNVGDGLLPSDLDGDTLPPPGSPSYFMGSMDNGAGYGAPQDALTLWKFTADFVTPANSSMVLAHTIPITPFDTIFPCSGRSCIPQPGTTAKVDILSYRQRPLHRLAYRNFGGHEALVTNQSVEAATGIAGVRWWEIRDPNGTPVIHQEGTYAPGVTDGVHRWMGSIAMDQSGNMALGYSASDATTTYPSSWYTGRLADDPLGTMPQGEASIVNGTGSQTGGSNRWGDYTSMNVDPSDDCTFWYVNQYLPTTSSSGWRLRIGAFRFEQCGCELTIAPPTVSATASGNNLILVDWDDSATPEITEYRVLRSFDAGGPYELVATVADSSPGAGGGTGYTYSDYDVSGGTEYFYVVRSSDGGACLSDPSNEASAVAAGDCTLAPLFDGVTAVVNPASNQCTLEVSWSEGVSRCSASLTYNVYRSTTSGFVPGPANRLASALAATSLVDSTDLESGVRHYYVVRAVDSVNGVEEENVVERSGVPTGPYTIGTWVDDAGDTGQASLTPQAPWSVAASGGNLGPAVYLTGTYGNSQCVSLTSPALRLGTGSTLTFWSKYQIENSYDKGVVEISSDGGSTWAKVPVNYPGNSTNATDACGLGTGSYFTGTTAGVNWAEYTAPLSTWADQDVILRWRLSTDSSVTASGWWVDDVTITDVMVPSDCSGAGVLFADDFESGTTNAWTYAVP